MEHSTIELRGAYLDMAEYNTLCEGRRHLHIHDVMVKVNITLFDEVQYIVLGHDLLTEKWYPLARPADKLGDAWNYRTLLLEDMKQAMVQGKMKGDTKHDNKEDF